MRETEWYPAFDGGTVFDLSPDDSQQWGSAEYVDVHYSDMPDYAGPYSATPLFSSQLFETANRVMRDDFAVAAINYTEAPNDSGITVTIGG